MTLIYLAIQSRQNHKLLQSNSFQSRTGMLMDLYGGIALSAQFAEILARRSDEPLTAAESMQVRYLHMA